MYYISVLVCLWKWKWYMVSLNCYFMLSQQEICFITYQVGMIFYMFLLSHEIPHWTGTFCLYRFPEKFLFPVHFQRSVIMVIARLFTNQAHIAYCVTGGHLGWVSNHLRGSGTVWKEAGKITKKKFFSPPFPGCVKISTPVPSVHIWNQDGHTYRAGKRSILTILHKGDCEKCR